MRRREDVVITYRLFCLKDGRILSTALFEAENDIAAVQAARAQRHPVNCELWCDSRLVAFIPAIVGQVSSPGT
jgi:hypothetical protein